MSRTERFVFARSRMLDTTARSVGEQADAGVIMQRGAGMCGREVVVDGKKMLNFGSCGYMGLQTRAELRDGAHRALDEYGTQFSFPRAFLQCPLYEELEAQLAEIAGRPVLVASSTTLGHMAALPVLVGDNDHLVIDQFAHASLHSAIQLIPRVPVEILRHSRMDKLESILERQREIAGNVWYVADGLYSMLGDFAPFDALRELLDRFPKLRLYIDDAHSTSWFGRHGRGAALEHFATDERVVVALSLNKAFSAAGGALAVSSHELLTRIRHCGGPMLFSGPIQPPMLGAAVASAALHLDARFSDWQADLMERLMLAKTIADRVSLPLAARDVSPIFQLQCDSPRIVVATVEALREQGFYCCPCVFPAVPLNRPGIRCTVSLHNELRDIEAFVPAVAEVLSSVTRAVARSSRDASYEQLAT